MFVHVYEINPGYMLVLVPKEFQNRAVDIDKIAKVLEIDTPRTWHMIDANFID